MNVESGICRFGAIKSGKSAYLTLIIAFLQTTGEPVKLEKKTAVCRIFWEDQLFSVDPQGGAT